MYLQFVEKLMREAGTELLDKMSSTETAAEVLKFYMFKQKNPGLRETSSALDKYWNWSRMKENQ